MAEKVTIATRLKAVEDGLAELAKRVLAIEEELGMVKVEKSVQVVPLVAEVKPPEEKPPEAEKPPETEKPLEEVRPEEKPAE